MTELYLSPCSYRPACLPGLNSLLWERPSQQPLESLNKLCPQIPFYLLFLAHNFPKQKARPECTFVLVGALKDLSVEFILFWCLGKDGCLSVSGWGCGVQQAARKWRIQPCTWFLCLAAQFSGAAFGVCSLLFLLKSSWNWTLQRPSCSEAFLTPIL